MRGVPNNFATGSRSNEFQATRERLHAKGIQLEACSQFGIGFLSCFLGGDKIEVDTHQWGNNPLTILIDGPSKYFLIKRHESLPARLNPFYAQDDPARDGPPLYPGTRVTVHLKPGWRSPTKEEQELNVSEEGVVALTLRKFAVNVDVPITIHRRTGPKSETAQYLIKARRWDEEEPLLPEGLPDFWREYLCPVRIPFENFEETRDIRGGAWFWFLKGQDGKPIFRKGFCSIGGSFLGGAIVVSDPLLNIAGVLKDAIEHKKLNASDIESVCKASSEGLNKHLHKIASYLEDDEIPEFDSIERDQLVRIVKGGYRLSTGSTSDSMTNEKLARALLEENRPKVLLHAKSEELCESYGCDWSFHVAQFGILVPAGILEFRLLQAESEHKEPFGGLPVTAKCDLWGSTAIPPSTNRLNIPCEKTSHIRLNLAYVAAETLQKIILDSDESKDWIRWIKDSFAFSGDSAHGLTYAWRKGRCLFLRENLSFLLAADGSTLRVSAKDLREQFGQWVPVAERDNGGGDKGHTDGIVSCTFPGLLFTLPRRQRPDGRREVDIVELC